MNWSKHVTNPNAPTDVDSISETIDQVFEQIIARGPTSIDLTGFKANEVQGEHLAGVLRALYTWRHIVPGWEAALVVAKETLGPNAWDALYGLL